MAKAGRESKTSQFPSSLPSPAQRFLSQALSHALANDWRTPDDFLRHFTPEEIMQRLEQAPTLRTELLVQAAGVNAKIARKKSTASATEDLKLALNEGLTDAAAVLGFLPADDRVRHLDHRQLWVFLAEGEFWTITTKRGPGEHDRACKRMVFLIECALNEQLISLKDMADGIGFQEVATRLPPLKLQKVVQHALECSRLDMPLNEEALLEVVPLTELVEYIPLEQFWNAVIVEKVARPAGFFGTPLAAPARTETTATANGSRRASRGPLPAPSAPPPTRHAPATSDPDIEFDAPPIAPDAQGLEAHEVIERLRQIDRLPPSHQQLPVAILLSIEGMYADLLEASDDDEREDCIREAFPNEAHLRTALIALIELLDPNINTEEPIIRDAEIDALIKVVLFEERQRGEARAGAEPAARGSGRPPPLPPPLPR
jgi:hypothetical protein